MSKSFFGPGKTFMGKPLTRGEQLQRQMDKDKQADRRLGQLGYSSRGIKPKKK